ncbi:TlpA family protein disulfide reductase [Deminuibacter soli]|nr:TlpA disulfide reductase family protein [Deminuibacter soli]
MKLILLSVVCFFCFNCYAGKNEDPAYPVVGKRCPDFLFTDIVNYPKKRLTLDDFKGKWLVLDLWTIFCGGCIESFPHMNAYQKEFAGQVQVLMVGKLDANAKAKWIFKKSTDKYNLQLACAFDSSLFARFDIREVPYTVVVDPDGIVKGIGGGIDRNQIAAYLRGESPVLFKAVRAHEIRFPTAYNPSAPFLIHGNGGADTGYLYRSVLTMYADSVTFRYPHHIAEFKPALRKFEVLGADLKDLYKYAYLGRAGWDIEDTGFYGKVAYQPILDIKDSENFIGDKVYKKNLYCYSLTVPRDKVKDSFLMRKMQYDLMGYFGYKASVVERMVNCWTLVVDDSVKMRASLTNKPHGIEKLSEYGYAANLSMKDLMSNLVIMNSRWPDPPFVDETGITSNIRLVFDSGWDDFSDAQRALAKSGLKLALTKKRMKVLLIQD